MLFFIFDNAPWIVREISFPLWIHKVYPVHADKGRVSTKPGFQQFGKKNPFHINVLELRYILL